MKVNSWFLPTKKMNLSTMLLRGKVIVFLLEKRKILKLKINIGMILGSKGKVNILIKRKRNKPGNLKDLVESVGRRIFLISSRTSLGISHFRKLKIEGNNIKLKESQKT